MTERNVTEKNITLYYADWCSHCVTFKPEWFKLKKVYQKRKQEILDKYKIKLVIDEYESDSDPQKINEAQVDGFPTIRITYNDKIDNYIGPRTALGLLKKVLQKPQDDEIISWLNEVNDAEPLYGQVKYDGAQTGGFRDSYRKYLKYKNKYNALFKN
jgi:thiol-disulfide isomerase/thioredoxin